jgi:hypothetical protein
MIEDQIKTLYPASRMWMTHLSLAFRFLSHRVAVTVIDPKLP